MTDRIRILVLMIRPAVVVLLGLFAATGLAQAGAADDPTVAVPVLAVVVAFLLFSVVVNDLADEAIDRVNLPNDARRPLVSGTGSRRDFVVVASTAGAFALVLSAALGTGALLIVVGGLALSLSYSLRPVRLADRGAVASLLLPAGYVAVPYLLAMVAAGADIARADFILLGGLYVGFIGRILLKDFRDVRGDALFGKRTFLVRHGRRRTCTVSAVCWIIGSLALVGVREVTPDLVVGYLAFVAAALLLLHSLGRNTDPRRDEALISAIAVVGRGMVVTVVGHLAMTSEGWATAPYRLVLGALVLVMLGQARTMAVRGPSTTLRIPAEWSHQVSTFGRFFPRLAAGAGAEASAREIHLRESAGSITSSNSK